MWWQIVVMLILFFILFKKPKPNKFYVTFVIPTVQRPSLYKALTSIQLQTSFKHVAIVIINDSNQPFKKTLIPEHLKHVFILDHESKGWPSPARNFGLKFIQQQFNTQWIAFLDDDDYLHPKYIQWLEDAEKFHQPDVVIFRATGEIQHIPAKAYIPNKHLRYLSLGNVTIAFAIQFKVLQFFNENIQVKRGNTGNLLIAEDFHYLQDCYKKGLKLIISPHIAYGVRKPVDSSINQDEAPYVEINKN